jgi:hypothetical protein
MGAGDALLALNWKGLEPEPEPEAGFPNSKLEVAVTAAPELKGLLMVPDEAAKLKFMPPVFPLPAGGLDAGPNMLLEGAGVEAGAVPELGAFQEKIGAAAGVVVFPRLEKIGFAGDLSSCFIGLPSTMELLKDVGGDLGANRGVELA